MVYETINFFKDSKFKRKTGISRVLFEILSEIINHELICKHKKGGRIPKLSAQNMLLMFLTYYRDYPTFFCLGSQFGLDEANVWRWIKWIENVLFKAFNYQNNDISFGNLINISALDAKKGKIQIVDVTECSIQRSKNIEVQKEYYSGKKKKHTIKIQIIIEQDTNKIVSITFEKGSVHDFSVFKESTKGFDDDTEFLADSGYQGIDKIFKHSTTPKKKSKNIPLTDEDKEFNHLISINRIPVEHTNCQVKIFRILSERYRSRIRTFFVPAILICEFYNLCL